jgi:hypothetical protein
VDDHCSINNLPPAEGKERKIKRKRKRKKGGK